jgi:hypothetical protein
VSKTLFLELFLPLSLKADTEVLFGMADSPFRGIFNHFVWRHQFEQKIQQLQNSRKL